MTIDVLLRPLRARWASYWPGADVEAIAADVRARFGAAVSAWDLSGVRALPGGEVALAFAADRGGRPVVLKVNPRGHEEEAQIAAEGDALGFWRATGAVPRLIDRRDGRFTILMERVVPGLALDAAGLSWADRLTQLGRLAARLHAAGPPPDTFIHLREYAAGWRRALADQPPLLAELDALLAPAASDVLVHADLHGGNALRHGDGWRAIDPHAARGDRHADVWALLDPLVPPLPEGGAAAARIARDWVEHYAGAADLDPRRAAAWVRLRGRAEALALVASAQVTSDDRAWAGRLHRMADALG